VRYADDFVIGFRSQEDAQRVLEMLSARMAAYGLTLHPDKTRLVPFGRPNREAASGKGPATFDFLGFTLYWRRARSGRWTMGMKTRKGRLQRAIVALGEFCRRHRHEPAQGAARFAREAPSGTPELLRVNGNHRALSYLVHRAEWTWHKWLCRRSQRKRLNWQRFKDLLKVFPLPAPRIGVQIWAKRP